MTINPIVSEPTNFDDIDFLIANFLDSTSIDISVGAINSVRRCVMGA